MSCCLMLHWQGRKNYSVLYSHARQVLRDVFLTVLEAGADARGVGSARGVPVLTAQVPPGPQASQKMAGAPKV